MNSAPTWGRLVQGAEESIWAKPWGLEEKGTQEQAYPSLGWQEGRSAVLDMHDIAGDSSTKGSRGQMMKGCGVRLRECEEAGVSLPHHSSRWAQVGALRGLTGHSALLLCASSYRHKARGAIEGPLCTMSPLRHRPPLTGSWEAAATFPAAPAPSGDAMLSSMPLEARTPQAHTQATSLWEFFHIP